MVRLAGGARRATPASTIKRYINSDYSSAEYSRDSYILHIDTRYLSEESLPKIIVMGDPRKLVKCKIKITGVPKNNFLLIKITNFFDYLNGV